MTVVLNNYINGEWVESRSSSFLDVVNPADGSLLARVPAGSGDDVALAAEKAYQAYLSWKEIPATQRIQYLFRMKQILEKNADEISEICTKESGKTFSESKAEIVRAVENIEVACGIPKLLQSEFSEDITKGIDEFVIRQR